MPVQDGIEGIDVDLVETSGICHWVQRKCRGHQGAGDVGSGFVTGDELVFPVVEVLLQLAVEYIEKVGEGIACKLPALPVKGGFGRGIRGVAEIKVKLLFDTLSRHGEEHHQGVIEFQFTVSDEVPAGVDGIFPRGSGDFIDCRKRQGFDSIRIFYKVYLLD